MARPPPVPPSPLGPAPARPRLVADYVSRTRHLTVNLAFLAPLVLVYLACWWWAGDTVETQAAASMRSLLRLLGPRTLFLLSLLAALALCAVVLLRLRSARGDAWVLPGMLVEGLVYGLLLREAAWALAQALPVGSWAGIPLARGAGEEVRAVGIAVGAGIFEELLFRGVLCAGAYAALRHVLGADRLSAGAIAVLLSAFLFAAYHHWGPGGEPWQQVRFTFRFHAGVVLGVVFLARGLGIAAFAHGFYDVVVLLS